MKPLMTLIRWHLRQLMLLNIAMLLAAIVYTMFTSERLILGRQVYMTLGCLIHAGLMVWILGRSATRGPGFLYSQGFSRDQLWWSTWLATVISGAMVSLTVLLIVISGLRSSTQFFLGNPWFPLMGAVDADISLWLLAFYLLLLGPMHYFWVRCRQPFGDQGAGWPILTGFILMVFGAIDRSIYSLSDEALLMHGASILMSTISVLSCWRLHRCVEVQA